MPDHALDQAAKTGPDAIYNVLRIAQVWVWGPQMDQYAVWGDENAEAPKKGRPVMKYPPGVLECPWEFFTTKWTQDVVRGDSPRRKYVPNPGQANLRLAGKILIPPMRGLPDPKNPSDDFGPLVWRTQIGQKALHETNGGSYGLPILSANPRHGDTQVLRYPTYDLDQYFNWPLYLLQLFTVNMERLWEFEKTRNFQEVARIKEYLGDLPKIAAILRAVNGGTASHNKPWFWRNSKDPNRSLDWMKDDLKAEHKKNGVGWNEELTILRLYIEGSLGYYHHRKDGQRDGEITCINYTPHAWPICLDDAETFKTAYTYWGQVVEENMTCAERLYNDEIKDWADSRHGGD